MRPTPDDELSPDSCISSEDTDHAPDASVAGYDGVTWRRRVRDATAWRRLGMGIVRRHGTDDCLDMCPGEPTSREKCSDRVEVPSHDVARPFAAAYLRSCGTVWG